MLFLPFTFLLFVLFANITCIQYHFAFLDACLIVVFHSPNNALLAPKTLLFNVYFALFSHVFYGSEWFCLYNCGEYLCLSTRIQQHFALRLAPKQLAFSTKTHCIQHQNALRLAAYCTAFSTKMHYIQQQIAQSMVQTAVLCNAYSFCRHPQLPPFCIQTNLHENRIFAVGWAVGGRKRHS